jgi:hypothetical protein
MKIEFGAVSIVLSKILNLLLVAFVAYVLFAKGGKVVSNDFYYLPFIYIMAV